MEIISRETLMAANAAFKLPSIPHISERIAEMRKIAQTSKVEHAIIVSRKTGDVLWASPEGTSCAVDVTDAWKAGLTEGNLIIHTHPIPAELSIPDLMCGANCGACGNMAVSPDGTVSWCTDPADSLCIPPWIFDDMAHEARKEHNVPRIPRESDPDFARKAACDNYWIGYDIRHYLEKRGLKWQTFYGDVCIANLTGSKQS